jgi:uncharacterized surface protein with fasciclin (FAS1) repeats
METEHFTFLKFLRMKSYTFSLLDQAIDSTVLAPEDGEWWKTFRYWFPALKQWLLGSRCFDRLDYFLKMSILPRTVTGYEVWATNAQVARRLAEGEAAAPVMHDMSEETIARIPAESRKLHNALPHSLWQGTAAPWEVLLIGSNSSVQGGPDRIVCDTPPNFNFLTSPAWTSEIKTTNGLVVALDGFVSPYAEPKMRFPTLSASRYLFTNPSLSTFSKLINVTNFCGEKQPWRDVCMSLNQMPNTIFAPVDEAFNLMTPDALQYLFNMSCSQCRKDAQAIIQYHLVGSPYESSYLRTGDFAELACVFHNVSVNTRQGEKLLIRTPSCSVLGDSKKRCDPIQLDLSCEVRDVGFHPERGNATYRLWNGKVITHEQLEGAFGWDWDPDYTEDLFSGSIEARVTNWWDVLIYFKTYYPNEAWLQSITTNFETAVPLDELQYLKSLSLYALFTLPSSDETIMRARLAVLQLFIWTGSYDISTLIIHARRLTQREACGASTVLPWADIETLSAVIHKINRVLIPPSIAARMPPAYISGVHSGGISHIEIIPESGASTATMALSAAAAVAAAGAVTSMTYQG